MIKTLTKLNKLFLIIKNGIFLPGQNRVLTGPNFLHLASRGARTEQRSKFLRQSYTCVGEQKKKKAMKKRCRKRGATRGLPRRSPILVLLSPKHASIVYYFFFIFLAFFEFCFLFHLSKLGQKLWNFLWCFIGRIRDFTSDFWKILKVLLKKKY